MAEPVIALSAVDRTKAAFDAVNRHFDTLEKRAVALGAPLLKVQAAMAALASVGAVLNVKGALEMGDTLNKLSQKVGITVESLSELKFAAELSDVSLESFAKGMRGLNEALVEANDNNSEAAKLLRALGVSARDPERALLQIADAFQKLKDPATESTVATTLFKKAGFEMIPLLKAGSAGIDEMRESARKLGVTMTGETSKAAEEFNDNMKKLGTGAQALGISLTARLVKGMAEYTGALVKAREEGGLFNALLEQTGKLALKAAEALPAGAGAIAGIFSQRAELQAQLEAASVQARTATGKIGGREETTDPDFTARVTCTLSGGTWDKATRRCIPKSTGGEKPISFDELMARAAQKRTEVQDEAEREGSAEAEKKAQELLELESRQALARLEFEDQQNEAADERIKKMQEQVQALREAYDPAARYREQLFAINELEREGAISAQEAAEMRQLVAKSMNEAAIKAEEFGDAVKKADDITKELGLTFSSAFEKAVTEGGKLSDVLRGLEQDIIRIIARKTVTEPLGNFITSSLGSMFGGGASGGGGAGGGVLGTIFQGFMGWLTGARAEGGPVMAGGAYLVGERGPELFRPRSAGDIVPNRALGGGLGQTININVAVPPGTSRETALQTAARTASMLNYARGYNG